MRSVPPPNMSSTGRRGKFGCLGLGFAILAVVAGPTPASAEDAGFHPLELTLTNPADKKFDVQTRVGYYTGSPRPKE